MRKPDVPLFDEAVVKEINEHILEEDIRNLFELNSWLKEQGFWMMSEPLSLSKRSILERSQNVRPD
eukprot:4459671-Ditylum_brightwellii.AAC.1